VDFIVNGTVQKRFDMSSRRPKIVDGNKVWRLLAKYRIRKYGKFVFTWFADSTKRVEEGNEDNNTKSTSHSLRRPFVYFGIDLVAVEAVVTGGSSPDIIAGELVYPGLIWKRLGKVPDQNYLVRRYMDGHQIGARYLGKDETGGNCNQGWHATPGWHELKCVIDADGVITENNEDNNEATLKFFVKSQ
jgi:subtilase family serine protease